MPKTDPNGTTPKQNLPAELHFERGPVICQHCRRKFEHFVLEEIDDLVQLRCGDVLLSRAEMACLHCGWIFFWKTPEKGLSRMAVKYGEFIVAMKGNNILDTQRKES